MNKIDLLLQGSPDSFYSKNYQYWLNGVDRKGQPGKKLAIFPLSFGNARPTKAFPCIADHNLEVSLDMID